MRCVLQRVTGASVTVGDRVVGAIGPGAVLLVGVAPGDTEQHARWLADKVANLRVWRDESGKMNRSLLDCGGEALVVSQFTLYGDARRGRRPSFIGAAQGDEARAVYEEVLTHLEALGVHCAAGDFGADMVVELSNDGPVTILLDYDKRF
jgi:D-aminoacyl-tRNA deacylase